jgi:hypothetical protein
MSLLTAWKFLPWPKAFSWIFAVIPYIIPKLTEIGNAQGNQSVLGFWGLAAIKVCQRQKKTRP